jgi:uncharacterized repeat protein (TIGR01451 family)
MSKSAATIVLLASSLATIAGGCAMPAGNGGKLPSMPGYSSAAPQPQFEPSEQAVAQVGYSGAASQPQIEPSEQAVAQVGFFRPAAPITANAGCNCNGCGTVDCSRPHGYVMQSTAGWNAHGLDPQEFICDGGDHPPAAMLRRDDSIAGLEAEDTVVHFTTEAGDIGIQASNRTCLYAPRFASVRKITGAVAGGRAVSLAQVDRPQGANRLDSDLPGLVMTETIELAHADVARRIDAMRERIRGVPVESILQPELAGDVMAAMVGLTVAEIGELRDNEKALLEQLSLAAVTWSLDEALEVAIQDLRVPTLTRDEHLQGFTIYDFPDAGRLQICKLADRSDALPGEIVNFAIRVQNVGDSAVDQVVLVDNLTTRLEYVDGSQTCSGGAEFEAVANSSQSLKLQWKLTDKLRVGESVTIRFQCKVR